MQMHTNKIMNLNVWIMLNMSGLHIGFEKDKKNLIFVLNLHNMNSERSCSKLHIFPTVAWSK